MGIQVKVGDVFLVPLDDKSWAFGQLVSAWNDELYIAVFNEQTQAQEADPYLIVEKKPIFLTLTLDAKLFHGHWPVIGNIKDNISNFPQPVYKVRQSGIVYLESRDRTFTRPASLNECRAVSYRTVASPALVEKAIQAHFGMGEWMPEYEKFSADYAYDSTLLLNS